MTTLPRREEMALRIACAIFQSPRVVRIASDDKATPLDVEEIGITAIEVADVMIAKLDEVPDA